MDATQLFHFFHYTIKLQVFSKFNLSRTIWNTPMICIIIQTDALHSDVLLVSGVVYYTHPLHVPGDVHQCYLDCVSIIIIQLIIRISISEFPGIGQWWFVCWGRTIKGCVAPIISCFRFYSSNRWGSNRFCREEKTSLDLLCIFLARGSNLRFINNVE